MASFVNFELKRIRSNVSSGVSFKNENMNSFFIEELGIFGKYNLYPNSKSGIENMSNFLNINEKNISLGHGSENLLRNLFLTLDYDSIQILEYSYEMALYYNKVLSKKIIINPLSFDGEFKFSNIIKLGGDLLYLVSPHSPTGLCFNTEDILNFSNKFKYVIVDEAYINPLIFNYPILDNVIFVRTFSKLGGVPGLRLGYSVSSEYIAEKINSLRDSYEITKDSIEYLNFIFKNNNLIEENINELFKCYSLLKNKVDCFSVHSGNFATFASNLFNGKKYKISDIDFTRVTLSDSMNHELLYRD